VVTAELRLDRADHLLERSCEPVRLVPGDEAARIGGDIEGVRELTEVGIRLPTRAGRQREQPRMEALVVQCVLEQEAGQRLRAQGRQTAVELAPRRRSGLFAELRGLREPYQADRDAVLAEQAVAADRTRAGADEPAGRFLEPHAVALRALHPGADRHVVPLERADHADLRVFLATLEGARARQAPERLPGHELRDGRLHFSRNLRERGDGAIAL
jgi:hypothetical protein